MFGRALGTHLSAHPLRNALVHHQFFESVRSAPLSRESVAVVVGQWWHPLHYFPDFLSRTISVVSMLSMKTAISKILYQELGEGTPTRAHEAIYVETMTSAGLPLASITGALPHDATRRLVRGYAQASTAAISALGFAYGTEVADLAMVSGIGDAVRRATGVRRLPWVDIHVIQEPDHVEQVNETLEPSFTVEEEAQLIRSAEEMWRLWIGFFTSVHEAMLATAGTVSTSPALVTL